ncbi:MAG TPA: dicarboxylate/amino acid:cation symporter [Sedimentibacter sp.]|mgnify:CR=1 FL=1|nr:dicarboxylate/amino acid:cation symporter [Sedimentibacter sp.]
MSKKKMGLAVKVLIGLAIGFVIGLIVHYMPAGTLRDDILINGVFQFVGQVFLRGIMMCVVPLVFVSLVSGAAGMGDVKKLGKVGVKTIVFYLVTTAIAIIIGLVIAFIINPGIGLDMGAIETVEVTASEGKPIAQVLYEMVPRNPIQALAEGNMLQIIVFAIMTGVALTMLGEKGKNVLKLFDELNELVMKLVSMVMVLAPLGVLCLVARTFGQVGIAAAIPLLKSVAAVYIALAIHLVVVYGGMLKALSGLSPLRFFKKFFPAMAVAFSTASSSATLPVTMDLTINKIGASKDISSFSLPLGATVNMDGTAIYQGVSAVFIAQVFGIQVTPAMALMIVFSATLASIGTAGVPGAGAIMLSMVLQTVGLPLEGLGLILGIDRLFDMGRTAMNITGDAVCTTIISKQEGEFNEEIWNTDFAKEEAAE